MRIALPFIALTVSTYVLFILISYLGLNPYIAGILFVAGFMVLVNYVLPLFDKRAPSELTGKEVKAFFESKIFWLALMNLIAVTLKELADVNLDSETQEEILQLDWANAFQAIVSILIIAVRKFDILKLIR